jgi:hypothetical protein
MGTPIVAGNRVLVTTTTTGTGTYQLGTAPASYFTPAQAGIPSGSRVDIVVMDSLTATTTIEITEGVYTAGSPATITRAQVKGGTNGTAAVNWGAGTKYILLTVHADRTPILDTDGLLPASVLPDTAMAQLLRIAPFTVGGSGVPTFFDFDTTVWNTIYPGGITTPTSGFTIPTSGVYQATLNMEMSGSAAGSYRAMRLYSGGAVRAYDLQLPSAPGNTFCLTWTGYVVAGQVINCSVAQNSGGNLTIGGTDACTLTLTRLRG